MVPLIINENKDNRNGNYIRTIKKIFMSSSQKSDFAEYFKKADEKGTFLQAWKRHGLAVLESLQMNHDPNICLDGVHGYYAKQAWPRDAAKMMTRISYFLETRSHSYALSVHFELSIDGPSLCIICQSQYRTWNEGESLRVIRVEAEDFRGCISSNDSAGHLQ
ncbi:MAG: hypothetical protein WC450_05060 [Candidatus Omnitrophota bacterium]|jgi:hypothetical protein